VIFRPDREDLKVIGHYLGTITMALAAVMALPLAVAVVRGDGNDVSALVIGTSVALGLGQFLRTRMRTTRELDWSHGLVTVALAWLLATAITAIPLYLSGHFGSWLDACFDAMSGYTTSGLSLLQDLDHLSVSMNLLRHMTHLAGGQGIVVAVLTVMSSAGAQISTLYVGEGREDRIVPSIVQTARFIWVVTGTYTVVGTTALWLATQDAGLTVGRGLFHAFNIFIAAFDTGGFSPNSTSMAYYHSASMEAVVLVLMIAGTLSFGLHHELWERRQRLALRNLELRSLGVTATITALIVVFGLVRAGTFDTVVPLYRKGIMTLVSAHTGTGFAFNASALYVSDWGLIAPAGIVVAMALGGMASSTAGGMKAIRIGLAAKSLGRDITRSIMPDAAVVVTSWTSTRRQVLRDDVVRPAVTIIVLYMLTYLVGAAVGLFYGYELTTALFESTSAAANVGLSSGLLAPDNPIPLKLVYLVQMWLGRLEFLAAFALVGWVWAMLRARV
jgi:trk system potassium uptake protein TrkH